MYDFQIKIFIIFSKSLHSLQLSVINSFEKESQV